MGHTTAVNAQGCRWVREAVPSTKAVSYTFGIAGIADVLISFLVSRYHYLFLILTGIVFFIAAIPTIPVSLGFLPCDTNTSSIAVIAVFIISGSSTYQNAIFERYTNFYVLLIIDSNFY
jgi:hypothetical protein